MIVKQKQGDLLPRSNSVEKKFKIDKYERRTIEYYVSEVPELCFSEYEGLTVTETELVGNPKI